MRNRLTQRIAADTVADKGTGIMNDPYQVNNPEHEKNDPGMADYNIGDPEKFGEGVNKDNLWKKDKRDPDTHIPEITAKMAADAIQAGRKLEEKAVKCIVASQRILPGAVDAVVESQAAELMHLPDNFVDSLLGRQEELASTIAKAAADTSEKVEKEEEKEEEKDAAKKEEDEAAAAKEKELEGLKAEKAALDAKIEKLAGEIPAGLKAFQEKQKAKKEEKPEEEKDAGAIPEGLKKFQEEQKAKKEDKPVEAKAEEKEEEKEEEKDAGKKVEPEEKKPEEKKPEDEISFGPEEGKEASENLLDDIFSSVMASDSKKGAKSLSGLVKKEASDNSDPLKGIWNAPPDVSEHFQ
jgi:hypothetical protein